jgi:hypothetical protein
MNKIKLCIVTTTIAFFFAACPVMNDDTELPWHFVPGLVDKSYQIKTAIAIGGSGDPRVALNYRMGSSAGAYYFDYVVLCSAKMRVNTSSAVPVFSLDTGDLNDILLNSDTYLRPLRLRGIKVVLEVINGGDGFTFANLPYTLRQQFAKTCKDTMVRYNLNGLSFKDINGDAPGKNLFAYPDSANPGLPQYYDAYFDDFPAFWSGNDEGSIGSRIAINDIIIPKNHTDPSDLTDTSVSNQMMTITGAAKLDYFWHMGGISYGNFLSYLRELDAWQTSDSNIAVIGKMEDAPLWVWETGFAGGHVADHTNMELTNINILGGTLKNQKSYLTYFICDWRRPSLTFTGITSNVVNIIISPNLPGDGFGWNNSGTGVLETANWEYCPGILDLGFTAGLTNMEIETFSRKFARGNEKMLGNGDGNPFWGMPYGLLYYTNVGSNDADKLSITSRIVYGGRIEDEMGTLIDLKEDGPAVVSRNQYSAQR